MTSDQYMPLNNTLTKEKAANGCFFDQRITMQPWAHNYKTL